MNNQYRVESGLDPLPIPQELQPGNIDDMSNLNLLQINDDRSANPSIYGDQNYSQGLNSIPQTPMHPSYSTPYPRDNKMSPDRNFEDQSQQTQAYIQNQAPVYQPQLSSFAPIQNQQVLNPSHANNMNPAFMPDQNNMYYDQSNVNPYKMPPPPMSMTNQVPQFNSNLDPSYIELQGNKNCKSLKLFDIV